MGVSPSWQQFGSPKLLLQLSAEVLHHQLSQFGMSSPKVICTELSWHHCSHGNIEVWILSHQEIPSSSPPAPPWSSGVEKLKAESGNVFVVGEGTGDPLPPSPQSHENGEGTVKGGSRIGTATFTSTRFPSGQVQPPGCPFPWKRPFPRDEGTGGAAEGLEQHFPLF